MIRISEDTKTANRRRLLEAAAVEFAEHGLDGANINRISVAAGLAKGTVYNYFASKEELFLAVVGHSCTLAAAGAAAVPAHAPTARRLHALISSDVRWATEHEPFARVLVRQVLAGDPRFHESVLAATEPYLSAVAAVLADGVARGEIRGDVPVAELALVFAGLGELAMVQHWGSGGAWPALAEIPDFVVRMFLEGAATATTRNPTPEQP